MCLEGRHSTGTYKEIPWKGTLQSPRPNERVRIKAGRNGKEHSSCLQKCLEISDKEDVACKILETVESEDDSEKNQDKTGGRQVFWWLTFFSHWNQPPGVFGTFLNFLQTVALCPCQMLHQWQVKAGDTLKLADLFSHEGDSWLVKRGI